MSNNKQKDQEALLACQVAAKDPKLQKFTEMEIW